MIDERPADEGGQNLDINEKDERNSYICPEEECNLIPEVLSAHCDVGRIVLRCNKGHLKELTVEEYFEILEKKKDIIPQSDSYDIPGQNNAINLRKTILDKIKSLSNIIAAYLHIFKAQDQYPKNYYHIQNLVNSRNFIRKENNSHIKSIDENLTRNIDDLIEENIKGANIIVEENKAIEILGQKYTIFLENRYLSQELYLKLKGSDKYTPLEDEGFKLLSKIRFRNLIELNLANNKIKDITPLEDMLLPHLEIINFSDNEIVEISPIANLASKKISEIYLQNNKIKSLGPFLNSNFHFLEIFRVDGNTDAIKDSSFKAICESKKYRNILFSQVKSWSNFIDNYQNNNLRQYITKGEITPANYLKITKMDLGSNRNGEILKDLFPLINHPNNIRYLILDDNRLNDVSYLTRIPLYNLEFLDLSLNLITNIKFMKKLFLKCKSITTLYLNDNKINDLTPLVKFENPNNLDLAINLKALTLKKNNLNLNDKMTLNILVALLNKSKEQKGEETFALDYEDKDIEQFIRERERLQ